MLGRAGEDALPCTNGGITRKESVGLGKARSEKTIGRSAPRLIIDPRNDPVARFASNVSIGRLILKINLVSYVCEPNKRETRDAEDSPRRPGATPEVGRFGGSTLVYSRGRVGAGVAAAGYESTTRTRGWKNRGEGGKARHGEQDPTKWDAGRVRSRRNAYLSAKHLSRAANQRGLSGRRSHARARERESRFRVMSVKLRRSRTAGRIARPSKSRRRIIVRFRFFSSFSLRPPPGAFLEDSRSLL